MVLRILDFLASDLNIWFYVDFWISFVADTKMIKPPAIEESFRSAYEFARRRAILPDERHFWLARIYVATSTIGATQMSG